MTTGEILTREEAANAGFAVFNNCNHVCLDLDQKPITISVRTPDGNGITFAFVERANGHGHQCVDIRHSNVHVNEKGLPIQIVSVRGNGQLLYYSRDDGSQATLTTVVL